MMRFIPLSFALAAAPASAWSTLTRGDVRHCWDERGNTVITEERSGDYVHGHDNQGRAWTMWEHNGRACTWPTRQGGGAQ
jgi:hypothetical protein